MCHPFLNLLRSQNMCCNCSFILACRCHIANVAFNSPCFQISCCSCPLSLLIKIFLVNCNLLLVFLLFFLYLFLIIIFISMKNLSISSYNFSLRVEIYFHLSLIVAYLSCAYGFYSSYQILVYKSSSPYVSHALQLPPHYGLVRQFPPLLISILQIEYAPYDLLISIQEVSTLHTNQ